VMFLELVAHARGTLASAWSSADPLASDLFRTRAMLDGVTFLLVGLSSGAGIGTAIALRPDDPLSVASGAPVAASFVASSAIVLVWAIATFLLDEIVLPVAWAAQLPLREGTERAWKLMRPRVPELLGYLAFRFVATLLSALFLFAIACMTCMVSWLPFVLAVLAVPFRVFLQSLSLTFLHELDPLSYEVYGPLPARA
jgi:pimeloyl-ACP methyl ester carboxylesterase